MFAMLKEELGVSTHIFRTIDPDAHFSLFNRCHLSLVELGLGYFPFIEDAGKFRQLQDAVARNNIHVCSFHLPYGGNMDISNPDPDVRRNTIDVVRLSVERLIALNARCLVIHPSVGAVEDDARKERLALCAEGLGECLNNLRAVQSANPNGGHLKIAVENMTPGGLGRDSSELIGLLEGLNSPELGICMDVNHANFREDLIEATHRYGTRIVTTHISDNDGVSEKHWMPGRGVIPWKEWLSALAATGYSGPFLYETSQSAGESDSDTVAQIAQSARDILGC